MREAWYNVGMNELSEAAKKVDFPYRPALFWDADPADIDPEKHAPFIIARIFARGSIDDVRWAKRTYGEEKLKQVVINNRTLDNKSQNFWCQYFQIDPQLCIRNRLSKIQSPFWTK